VTCFKFLLSTFTAISPVHREAKPCKPISLRPVIPTSPKNRPSTISLFLASFYAWCFIFLCFILKPCIRLEKEFSGFWNRRHMTDSLVTRLRAWRPGDRFNSRLQNYADPSPPSNPKVKNAFSYTIAAPWVFTAWYLIKHRYFTFFTLLIPPITASFIIGSYSPTSFIHLLILF